MKRLVLTAALLAIVLIPGSVNLACISESMAPVELEIPSYYTTYTQEAQLFSISYPSYWTTPMSQDPELEQEASQAISRLETGLPVGDISVIFYAGAQTMQGYNPNINIAVGTVPAGIRSHSQMVAAELQALKIVAPNHKVLSRTNTTIDGRKATIIDWEGDVRGEGKMHLIQMLTLVDETVWMVTCSAYPDSFSEWKIDFNIIVRTLQIYK